MTKEEYWTDEVEEALAKYVTCKDCDEKNLIFTKYLHVPLLKLIDAIVERYRPDAKDMHTDETRTDLLYSLILHVQKFNPNAILPSGKKASGHSYCSIIIRSSIAEHTVRTYREKKTIISFDDWYKEHPEI